MTTKWKVAIGAALIAVIFAAGYFTHSYRTSNRIAGYEKREQERLAQIAANDAEQNQLRGENKTLREHAAKLSAEDEGLRAIIDNRGGVIAAEAKNLETINDQLKTDQTVINSPTDKCIRCRAFSDAALRAKQIGKPLSCKDECPGVNQ